MRLTDAYKLFELEAGRLNTDQSRESYRRTVQQLAAFAGNKALSSYTAEELTAFCLGGDGRGEAPRTITGRKTRVCSLFHWLTYRKLVAKDPTVDLAYTVCPRGGGVRKRTWLTKAETGELATHFNLEDPRGHRDYVVYRTTLMLGLRRSETASLRWPMFAADLSDVTIVGKGRKMATLPLPAALRTCLDRWRRLEPADAVPFPRFRFENGFVTGERGRQEALWQTPIGPDGVYKIIRQHTPVAPHDLRASFAGILDTDGVPLKVVQGLMRHDNLATTDRYLERSPARLARVVDTVDWGSS
jgi:site-specific recombinase XerC